MQMKLASILAFVNKMPVFFNLVCFSNVAAHLFEYGYKNVFD